MDDKATLLHYLRQSRSDLLGKLDGLDEYDARRPLTPTGTNLLGLVRHVASTQLVYFTDVFGRPAQVDAPWLADDAEAEADMWVPATDSRESVTAFHELSARLADETIEALPLDAPGEVPWWRPESRSVTLHRILVHMVSETARHAGHADILRELIDSTVGGRPGDPNVPDRSTAEWSAYTARIEQAAQDAAQPSPAAVNARVIEQFRAGGEIEGMHRDRLLLLTTTGRTSGRARTAPMMVHVDPDDATRHVVIASNMGAAEHPAWFLNLAAHPQVHVEVADEEYDALAVAAEGKEYDRLWSAITTAYPFLLEHQERTSRQIPLVVLERR